MNYDALISKFSGTTRDRQKAIFSTLFIAGNRLQTLFDSRIPALSLKQFMLLSVARQSQEPLTLTHMGNLLGCSRQNVRKVAEVLEKKGFVTLCRSGADTRAVCVCPTEKAHRYFREEFSAYQDELGTLFSVYTEEETETLFRLLTRLYGGIENLENTVHKSEGKGAAVV